MKTDAGMDGYLTKPIRPEEPETILELYAGQKVRAADQDAEPVST